MRQQRALEIKVGAFIVLGFALLVFFIFAIGDLSAYFTPGQIIRARFTSVNGVAAGSPVRYAGVEVGKVVGSKVLKPDDENKVLVELEMRLPQHVTLRAQDTVWIYSMGLLGEKLVEIAPGPADAPPADGKTPFYGITPPSTDEMLMRTNTVLGQMEKMLEVAEKLINDPEATEVVKETITETRDAARQWKLVGERINLLLTEAKEGEGNLGKFIYDDTLYNKSIELIDDIKKHPWKLLRKSKN